VWEYGYSFFKTSCEAANQIRRFISQDLAVAIRVAIGADEQTWKQFMKTE